MEGHTCPLRLSAVSACFVRIAYHADPGGRYQNTDCKAGDRIHPVSVQAAVRLKGRQHRCLKRQQRYQSVGCPYGSNRKQKGGTHFSDLDHVHHCHNDFIEGIGRNGDYNNF